MINRDNINGILAAALVILTINSALFVVNYDIHKHKLKYNNNELIKFNIYISAKTVQALSNLLV